MRALWVGRRCLWLSLLLIAGCWSTDWTKNLTKKRDQRPPPQPEEFILPPVTAARFSAPPDYPQQAQKDKQPKDKFELPTVPGAAPGGSRMGSGAGMRAGY